jgi:hypothetical protein
MFGPSNPVSKLKIKNPQEIEESLKDLRFQKTGINWVLLAYDKDELVLKSSGKGGLDEVNANITEDDLCYIVMQVVSITLLLPLNMRSSKETHIIL